MVSLRVTKWIKDLNINPNTIRLLEENKGTFTDIGPGKDFLDIMLKALTTKTKVNKWNSKASAEKKKQFNKIKQQPTE